MVLQNLPHHVIVEALLMQAALASGDPTLSLAIAKQQDERFLDMPHDR
jgi:hypothetical protein